MDILDGIFMVVCSIYMLFEFVLPMLALLHAALCGLARLVRWARRTLSDGIASLTGQR